MWGGRVVAVSTITMRALGQPPSSARLRRHQHLHHAGFGFAVVDLLLITSICPKAR
jgi:hypothetical protein